MKKKLLLALWVIVLSLLVFGTISASAETEGIYTYSVSNGTAIITGCDESVMGNVVIPNTLGGYPVTSIGSHAFSHCSGIMNITIPDSVTYIGVCAFYNCTGLKSITLSDNVKTLDSAAFQDCTGLTEVVIGNGITKINKETFYRCTGLTTVTLGNSITSIGKDAFYDCENIKDVYITDLSAWCNINFYDPSPFPGDIPNPLYYGANLYLNDVLVTELVIPDGITEIKRHAFRGCESIKSVVIPDSLEYIGETAFPYWGIEKVYVKDIVSWCNVGFYDSYSPLRNAESLYINNELVTELIIPAEVESIGSQFKGFGGITKLTINSSDTVISDYAFSDCENLEYVVFKTAFEEIPVGMFESCHNLKYICMPAEIKYIRNDAFNECDSIDTVFYAGSEAEWNEILFYSRNENIANANIVYNATQKTYKFETNCNVTLSDITDYAIFTMPSVENDGMTLNGWYDNKSLSGEPVTFPYYGDATTLYASWTDRTGKSFDDAFTAKANQEYTVSTTESGQLVYFQFVPNLSKEYRFYTTGSKDTYGYLYDGNQSRLTSDDDSGDGSNFYISYNLTAGETYYIAAKLYSGTGTFTLVTEEPVDYRINEITIKDMSGNSLQTIPTGTFLATVSFTNVSSSADTVIILAQYTDAGAFKGLMYIQTEDVPTGSTIKLSIPVDNSNGDVAKLKAFCWESFGSLTPMGNLASFPAE